MIRGAWLNSAQSSCQATASFEANNVSYISAVRLSLRYKLQFLMQSLIIGSGNIKFLGGFDVPNRLE